MPETVGVHLFRYVSNRVTQLLFSGYMLVNWYLSEFAEHHHLKQLLNAQDLKFLAIQFCTHLLAAGVLHQIPDKDVPMYNIFKVDIVLTPISILPSSSALSFS